jgi:hypothetical protein
LTIYLLFITRKEQIISLVKSKMSRRFILLYIAMFYICTNGFTIYHLLYNI